MKVGLFVASMVGFCLAGRAHAERFKVDPYLQSVTAHSIVIMWRTDVGEPGKIVVSSPVEPDRVIEVEPGTRHEVTVTGLRAGRRYTYVVETGSVRAGGEFATAPEGDEPYSFVVFGDSRSNAGSHRVLAERVSREVPDFILGTGDMVNTGAREQEWRKFFEIEADLLRNNVLFPSLGNHDRTSAGNARYYRSYFAVPDNSPNPERYYAFTYGNSRFLVLDSNSNSFALTDQTAWLERELRMAISNPNVRHIFVSMHHPPYSVSLHGGQPELREMWTPLFERYGVDAVFSGHDHCYLRAFKNGVNYFVVGGGGAPLYPRDPRASALDVDATVYFERTYVYLRAQVVHDFVEVAAVRGDGTLIETLSWGELPRLIAHKAPPAHKGLTPHAVRTAGPGGGADSEGAQACTVCPSRVRAPAGVLAGLGALLLIVARRRAGRGQRALRVTR